MTKYYIRGTEFEIDVSDFHRTVTSEEREEFLEKHPEVQAWLRRKAEGTRQYLRHLIIYCEEIRAYDEQQNSYPITPAKLLDLKKDYGDLRAEELLEAHQEEINKTYGIRYKGRIFGISQEFNLTTSIKSWYSFNGKALAKGRAAYHWKRVREKVKFTKGDLIKFVHGQPRNFRAFVGLNSSFPARIGTMLKLDWEDVKEIFDDSIILPHIDVEPELLKKSLMEKGLHQHGFIHSWAKKILLEWKEEYEEITGKKIDIAKPESLKQPLFIGRRSKKRLTHSGVEKWFRDRSKEMGLKITPHSFRAYVKTNLTCDEDMKAVFLAQSGRYDRAYSMELTERMKEEFLQAAPKINPLFKDTFENSKKVLNEKFGGRLTEEEIQWIGQRMSLGLLRMEEEFRNMKDRFLSDFLEKAAIQLREI